MSLSNRKTAILLAVASLPVLLYWSYTSATMHRFLFGAFSTAVAAAAAQVYCPPPGPSLPPPKILSDSVKFDRRSLKFEDLPWDPDTSYAIKASIGETVIVEHEYTAPGRDVGQTLLETSLRIGSVTKTFTMLAILLSADKIKLSDSITRFIPELDKAAYQDVTIAALASHTSGLGRYIYVGDLAIVPGFNPATLGLPSVNSTDDKVPTCDPFPGGRVCTYEEIIAGLNDPAYRPRSPGSGPLYSNIGYTLLGMTLQAVHNKSSEQVIQDLIITPLGLSQTSFSIPINDSAALLPRSKADAGWFVPDFGNYNPSGGLWSTPNDLLILLQSILSHKLLSRAETRRWLQPRALLPSLHQAVGDSWEILRPMDLDVNTGRPIDIFTKTGGVTGYAAYTAVIPEYNIALTINAAGGQANNVVSTLFPQLVKPLVAYADNLARQQVRLEYAGTYSATAADGASSIVLEVDDGPGLSVTGLTMNDVSVLHSLAAMQKIPFASLDARLYPSDFDSSGTGGEVWRIMIGKKHRDAGFAELQCASWNWGDAFRYITEPLDTVVFSKRVDGSQYIELLGWRAQLHRM